MGVLVTLILGIFILVGALLVKCTKNSKVIEQISIAIALGTMSSLVIVELIPEVLEIFETESIINTSLIITFFIFIGIFILKILDKFIPEHDHGHGFDHNCTSDNVKHIGIVSSVAIILHNIIEGMAVVSIVNESFKVGLLVALGVGLHNIPMGMVIASTLNKSNIGKKKSVIVLFSAVLSTFIGGLLMMLISSLLNEIVIGILICITLGMLIYIIMCELIPHLLHSKNKHISIIGITVGIVIIIVSTMLE